mgnify:CR=1 FL=1
MKNEPQSARPRGPSGLGPRMPRRHFIRGTAGVVLGLPALESLAPRRALAAPADVPPFAIFFRQANGVQQGGQNDEIGREPERFWPTTTGALSPDTMRGRAVEELVDHRDRLLLAKVNMMPYDYGDGHARGAMQGLTAAPAEVAGRGGNSEAGGESLDHRIGRELNPDGRDSLYLYAGRNSGWLGGSCISYRGPGQRRSALNNPWNAYQSFVSDGQSLPPDVQQAIAVRGQSVNDLVRAQLGSLMSMPRLSSADRARIELHQQSIRDLEVSLTCQLAEDRARALENEAPGFDSTDGDQVLATARLHMEVATLAVACGQTRSVAIQVGNGNDASTRYRNPESGQLMENFHYISHRRLSHDSSGAVIANADYLHHLIDRQFAQAFRHLLDRLDAYPMPGGGSLLESGMAIWYNDLGDGPPHSPLSCPFVIAGSAGGQLVQGRFFDFDEGWGSSQHRQLLNTVGAAVGLTNARGEPLDDFGSAQAPGGRLDRLLA